MPMAPVLRASTAIMSENSLTCPSLTPTSFGNPPTSPDFFSNQENTTGLQASINSAMMAAGKMNTTQLVFFSEDRVPEELYDLESDLGETTNLAEKHPKKVQELRALMKTMAEARHKPVPVGNDK